eukprot:IDg8553t1
MSAGEVVPDDSEKATPAVVPSLPHNSTSPDSPTPLSAYLNQPRSSGGLAKNYRLTSTDNLIISREVAETKAHIAAFETTAKVFAQASKYTKKDAQISITTTAKSLQHRRKNIRPLGRLEEKDV